jgi:hypothetical protein
MEMLMFISLLYPRRRKVLVLTLLALGFAGAVSASGQVTADDSRPLATIPEPERVAMAAEIVTIANRVANGRKYFDEEVRPISITGSFDVERNLFRFDMEERFGPEAGYDELANMHRDIEIAIESLTDQVEKLYMIDWTYGGKDIEHWMPGPAGDEPSTKMFPTSAVHETSETVPSPVVVAAGHGYYYHLKEKAWKPYRSPSNGVLEDEVTPLLATGLAKSLRASRFTVEELRPVQLGPVHEPSNRPWWHLGARYRLAATLPDNPEIWNSLPASSDAGRERREDIKSRPLYANHVAAPAIIHVHTNATDTDPSVNGARIYIAPGRPKDAELAKLALCSMKEVIHAIDRFKAFKVSSEPHAAKDNAENNLAKVPSIIVETAFHTNPGDAELLKDPEFQNVSMMGVAKGYRLFVEGKSCETFSVAKIEAVEAFVGQQVNRSVAVSGHPVFPVDIIYTPSRCRTAPCESERKVVFNQAGMDAFRIPYFCAADDVKKGPIDFVTWARDAMRVKTNEETFHLTCKARNG